MTTDPFANALAAIDNAERVGHLAGDNSTVRWPTRSALSMAASALANGSVVMSTS